MNFLLYVVSCKLLVYVNAGVVKLAYTPALGAGGRNPVGVQVSPPAPVSVLKKPEAYVSGFFSTFDCGVCHCISQ